MSNSFATPWTVAHHSSVYGISQARILVWDAISFSRGSSWPRNRTRVSCTAGQNICVKLTHFAHRRCWHNIINQLHHNFLKRDWGQEEKGMTQDEMAGRHHRLSGRESEWTLGDGDGQGGLACCDSWSHKESDTTERLNWTELNI